ncbi:hypothetical protein RB653_010071 [Dictyostelium firmibasis]|uniref:Uncharacterized protein n=1 Tax=Dictyostelium firmibasis TaxID=79012 RepID=A0AAN7TJJ9_9MYCE
MKTFPQGNFKFWFAIILKSFHTDHNGENGIYQSPSNLFRINLPTNGSIIILVYYSKKNLVKVLFSHFSKKKKKKKKKTKIMNKW